MKDLEQNRSEARERLMKYGVRPSAQRVAIMQYLLTHYTHPTVDDIYNDLCPFIKTLSRTTVYNTLRMFSEVGAANMITIDDHHVAYDGNNKPHAHLLCRNCGRVVDLWETPGMPTQHPRREQEGCLIDEIQVYYKGLCPKCRKAVN